MEEDIKVLDKNGAKLLLKQTKEYINVLDNEINNKFDNEIKDINSSIIANKDTIKNIKKNTDCIKSTISTFSDDEQYHIFNIRAVNDYNFNFFRIRYNVDKMYGAGRNFLSINYPYVKKSYNISKSASAIYIANDIRFRSFPDSNNDNDVLTLAVFNRDKSHIRSLKNIYFNILRDDDDTYIRLNDSIGILLHTTRNNIKMHLTLYDNKISLTDNGICISSNTRDIKLSTNYNQSRIKLTPSTSNFVNKTFPRLYDFKNKNYYEGCCTGLIIGNMYNTSSRKHINIRLNDIAGSSMLLSKVSNIEYGINVNNKLYVGQCLRNTLYYPKSLFYNNDCFLNIKHHINRRLAINCISKPYLTIDDRYIKGYNILELSGHEINIGTNNPRENGQLNVKYISEFNNLTRFNSSIIFSSSNSSGLYYNIIDKYNNPFLINQEIQDSSNNRINQVNAYFCTLYKDNSDFVKLLKLTPTVGFLILKKPSDVTPKKAVEYNLEQDSFSIKSNVTYIKSLNKININADQLRIGHYQDKINDKKRIYIDLYCIKTIFGDFSLRIDLSGVRIGVHNCYTKFMLDYNDLLLHAERDMYLRSRSYINLLAGENKISKSRPVLKLSPTRVHLDDCLGMAMLDNNTVDQYGNTETYLNYPEILSTASDSGVLVDTEHAIKLQRNLASNPNGEFIGNSTLTLNGNNVYLDGFKSDATLSTIFSSEFGLYFLSSDNDNEYKCDLLKLIKAILIKLIS